MKDYMSACQKADVDPVQVCQMQDHLDKSVPSFGAIRTTAFART